MSTLLGILLYASGLVVLDKSLHLPAHTSMLTDLMMFQAGCMLMIAGVYLSTIHRSLKSKSRREQREREASSRISAYPFE